MAGAWDVFGDDDAGAPAPASVPPRASAHAFFARAASCWRAPSPARARRRARWSWISRRARAPSSPSARSATPTPRSRWSPWSRARATPPPRSSSRASVDALRRLSSPRPRPRPPPPSTPPATPLTPPPFSPRGAALERALERADERGAARPPAAAFAAAMDAAEAATLLAEAATIAGEDAPVLGGGGGGGGADAANWVGARVSVAFALAAKAAARDASSDEAHRPSSNASSERASERVSSSNASGAPLPSLPTTLAPASRAAARSAASKAASREVPAETADALRVAEFHERFFKPRAPVVVRGVMRRDAWTAPERFRDLEWLRDEHGDAPVPAEIGASPSPDPDARATRDDGPGERPGRDVPVPGGRSVPVPGGGSVPVQGDDRDRRPGEREDRAPGPGGEDGSSSRDGDRRASSGDKYRRPPTWMPLRRFLETYMRGAEEEHESNAEESRASPDAKRTFSPPRPSVAYVSQHSLLHQRPGLQAHFAPPEYCMGRLLSANAWLGTEGTVTHLHTDEADNLLCQVAGFKLVLIYPPETAPCMYEEDDPEGEDESQDEGGASGARSDARIKNTAPRSGSGRREDGARGDNGGGTRARNAATNVGSGTNRFARAWTRRRRGRGSGGRGSRAREASARGPSWARTTSSSSRGGTGTTCERSPQPSASTSGSDRHVRRGDASSAREPHRRVRVSLIVECRILSRVKGSSSTSTRTPY